MVIFASKDIGKMTWAQIKQLAQDARSNPEQYYGYLGTSKKVNCSNFRFDSSETAYGGPINVYLVDVISGKTYGSAHPGFVFLFNREHGATCYHKDVSVDVVPYYKDYSIYKETLQGGAMYNAIQDKDFLDNLETVSFKYISGYSSLPTVQDNKWPGTPNISATSTLSSKFVGPDLFEFIKEDATQSDIDVGNYVDAWDEFENSKNSSLAKSIKMDYFKNIVPTMLGSKIYIGGWPSGIQFPRSAYSAFYSQHTYEAVKVGMFAWNTFQIGYGEIELRYYSGQYWYNFKGSSHSGSAQSVSISAPDSFLCFM